MIAIWLCSYCIYVLLFVISLQVCAYFYLPLGPTRNHCDSDSRIVLWHWLMSCLLYVYLLTAQHTVPGPCTAAIPLCQQQQQQQQLVCWLYPCHLSTPHLNTLVYEKLASHKHNTWPITKLTAPHQQRLYSKCLRKVKSTSTNLLQSESTQRAREAMHPALTTTPWV